MAIVYLAPKVVAMVQWTGSNQSEVEDFVSNELGFTITDSDVDGTSLVLTITETGGNNVIPVDAWVYSPHVGGAGHWAALGQMSTQQKDTFYTQVYP